MLDQGTLVQHWFHPAPSLWKPSWWDTDHKSVEVQVALWLPGPWEAGLWNIEGRPLELHRRLMMHALLSSLPMKDFFSKCFLKYVLIEDQKIWVLLYLSFFGGCCSFLCLRLYLDVVQLTASNLILYCPLLLQLMPSLTVEQSQVSEKSCSHQWKLQVCLLKHWILMCESHLNGTHSMKSAIDIVLVWSSICGDIFSDPLPVLSWPTLYCNTASLHWVLK